MPWQITSLTLVQQLLGNPWYPSGAGLWPCLTVYSMHQPVDFLGRDAGFDKRSDIVHQLCVEPAGGAWRCVQPG